MAGAAPPDPCCHDTYHVKVEPPPLTNPGYGPDYIDGFLIVNSAIFFYQMYGNPLNYICDLLSENRTSLYFIKTSFYNFFVIQREKPMGCQITWCIVVELQR